MVMEEFPLTLSSVSELLRLKLLRRLILVLDLWLLFGEGGRMCRGSPGWSRLLLALPSGG